MNGVEMIGTDAAFQNPGVEYQYLDPAFWFDKITIFIKWVFIVITSGELWDLVSGIGYALGIFFITLICYCAVRMLEIRKKEHDHIHHEIHEYAHRMKEKEKAQKAKEAVSRNPAWVRVIELVSSTNMNDWKLAVMEADSILDNMMREMGFRGENLGERLRNADRDKFKTLSAAWEAHAVRNRVAHEPAYDISLHEARRVIALYESIFREFGYI